MMTVTLTFVTIVYILLISPSASFKSFSSSLFRSSTAMADAIGSLLSSQPLPWTESVDLSRELTYMDMFNTQLNLIRKLGMQEVSLEEKFVIQQSDKKKGRIANLCFKNEKYRKVRLTYFDAGDAVQVFNALWYPSYEYDVPLLGVDLISIGQTRVLSVIDFQPIHPTTEYSTKYISPLQEIRDKYPDLHGTLSGKFYDDTSFFSNQMLFGRFTDESKVKPVVGPAFTDYLHAYVNTMDNAIPNKDPSAMAIIQERQRAYDTYSAAKDPAIGLFDAYFGKEWSTSFVHDFLFELSKVESSTSTGLPLSQPVHTFKLNADGHVIDSPSRHATTSTSTIVSQSHMSQSSTNTAIPTTTTTTTTSNIPSIPTTSSRTNVIKKNIIIEKIDVSV